ncbi:MAG: DUF3073 domain-containing protein [Propionibacteriaceae bacterium]|jgi:hypothetical protein|nr:DUF3073 domain-containing protein [Propionibacteriaceae bacterium]
MGRGRAKAKQTKVARELKYRSVSTDFALLEAELRSPAGADDIPPAYADLATAYGDDGDDEDADSDAGQRPAE